jgi:hypothetical protein
VGKGALESVGGVSKTLTTGAITYTNRPFVATAWTNNTPTLGIGTIVRSAAKGGITTDGHSPTDPDQYVAAPVFELE